MKGTVFMANYRQNKINSAVECEMASILREIKDPRVADAFVTITAARVSPDLKYCKLYYSSLMGDKREIGAGLRSAAGFIRSRLAERLNLRITPELTFEPDGSIEHGAHIAEVLRGIEKERRERESNSPDAESDEDEAETEENTGEGDGEE